MICLQKRFKQSRSSVVVLVFLLAIMPSTAFATTKADQIKIKNDLTYIAIGDSLTEGLLENGEFSETGGYYGHIVHALIKNGYTVDSINYAKAGATSAEVLAQVEHLTNHPNGADILTVSVGANDIVPYLKPLSNKKFKQNIADARETIQQLQDNVELAEDTYYHSEKTFNQLITDLVTLQDFVEETIIQAEDDPAFALQADADKALKRLKLFSISISNNVHTIKEVMKKTSLPDDEVNEAIIEELYAKLPNTLKTTYKEIALMKDDHVNFSYMFHGLPLTSDDTFTQANVIFQNTYESLTNGQKQLVTINDTIQLLNQSFEQATKAETVIDNGKQTIENAFVNAYGVLGTTGDNLETIIEQANEINPDVDIYVLGYYNTLPYLSEGFQKKIIALLQTLNQTIETTAIANGATYVPSYDAFDGRYNELLPNRHDIHPSEAGYQVIAKQFISILQNKYPPILEEEQPKTSKHGK